MTLLTFPVFASLIGGYLVGSIPFGLVATRLGGAGDVRKIGSGNIGATNVLRTGRRDLALVTLLGDAGKGAVAVLLASQLWGAQAGALAGGAAFLGHLFPVWLRFRGGKGVATFFGVMIAADWPAGLAAGAVWIAVAAALRYSSLAALAAAASAPVIAFFLSGLAPTFWLAAFMATLIYISHRANIGRLIGGSEPRIGARKPPGEA